MNNKIKMVISDVDGTLCPIYGRPNEKTIQTVHKLTQLGIKMVIATGRMYKAAKYIADDLNIDTPIVCYQGAMIRDEKEVYFEQNVPKETVFEIIDHLRNYGAHINLYMRDRLIVENDDKYIKEYAGDRDINYEVVDDLKSVAEYATKMLAIHEDADKVTFIRDEMQKNYPALNIVKSTDYYCEFVNPKADKGYALQFLGEKWGIKKEEILAIGDQDNDIQMLQAAGIGVAMGNGSKNIKKIADYICPSVDETGFVDAIEKFVL